MRENRLSGLMQGRELSAVHSAANSCLLYLVYNARPVRRATSSVSRLSP